MLHSILLRLNGIQLSKEKNSLISRVPCRIREGVIQDAVIVHELANVVRVVPSVLQPDRKIIMVELLLDKLGVTTYQ